MKREVLDKMRMASLLFTIEQFELLRRLRASGITKDQVALAFDHFDRLDWELQVGNIQGLLKNRENTPRSANQATSAASNSPPQLNGNRTPLTPLLIRDQERTPSTGDKDILQNGNGTNGDHNGSHTRPKSSGQSACSVSSNEDSSLTESGRDQMTPPLQLTSKSPPPHRISTDSSSLLPAMLNAGAQSDSERESIQVAAALMWPIMAQQASQNGSNGSHNSVIACQTPTRDLAPYLSDDYCPPDVEELKRKGEEALLNEIRNFVMRYNIKQTMIAEMTKMSQAYVSRFFRGDIADMSERTKNTFYMWYLTCKNNPWKLGVKRMVSESGDLIPLKRERFTFKSAHLAVLEKYYERDPYPDAQTREQIVDECNSAVERPDRPLADREKVTLPVVNNWFNNRRKEAKKQLRQQHVALANAASAQQASPPPVFAAALHAMGWPQQLLQNSANALSAIAGASSMQPSSPTVQHPDDDDDDSRGSYSIPEETMAIDFSEGGAAAREAKMSELKIKQEAVS